MGTFIIIAIVVFIIFIIVQLTDTSPVETVVYNYKGKYFGNDADFQMRPSRTVFSIQKKFITINYGPFAEPLKMRILNSKWNSNYELYFCMDGHRNQHTVIRSKMNNELIDGIIVTYGLFQEIYSDNPNIANDLDKIDALLH